MRKYCTIIGLLLVVVLPVCAQNWTPQDSLRLRRLLDGEGEIKLNPEVLKEMGVQEPLGKQQISMEKQWLDFNTTLPEIPNTPKKKVVLTLRPYTATTKYNWDPVYQKTRGEGILSMNLKYFAFIPIGQRRLSKRVSVKVWMK